MLDTRTDKRTVTKNSRDGAIAEIEKKCIEVLEGSEKIPKIGMTHCLKGSVWKIFSKINDNKSECLKVLRTMINLAKQIMQSNKRILEQKQKLIEGMPSIVVGTDISISQLARANIFRFLTATLNADTLKASHLRKDNLYTDIQLKVAIGTGERGTEIGKRVPLISSQSQKIYAYQSTGGIGKAAESAFQLLDLNARDAIPIVMVGYGFGGIGKITLTVANDVYAHLGLQSYKHCRIHMNQDCLGLQSYKHSRIHMNQECTKSYLKGLQQQTWNGLFKYILLLKNCGELFFKENFNQPLFLYIDNGLKSTDLEQPQLTIKRSNTIIF